MPNYIKNIFFKSRRVFLSLLLVLLHINVYADGSDSISIDAKYYPDVALIDAMSLEERRVYYEKISKNKPYVSIAEVLDILDRGLVDDDDKVKRSAIARFIKSFYRYGAREPSELFNKDAERKAIFVNFLSETNKAIRSGAFRVLSENYYQQEDVAKALVEAAYNESTERRLGMARNLTWVMESHPGIVKPFYIDEVLAWPINESGRIIPAVAAFVLSNYSDPPLEIIEPVIEMLETDEAFGSSMLLNTLKNYGPFVKPYIERLKQLQVRVNSEIVNKSYTYKQSERQTSTYTTFSKDAYTEFIETLEQL